MVHANARDAQTVLAAAGDVLDLTRPVGVLAVGVLHYLADDDAATAVRVYTDALVPGSRIAISHLTGSGRPDIETWATINHGGWSYAPRLRDPADMLEWLAGLDVPDPGWVSAPEWRPEGTVPGADVTASGLWGVVAQCPPPQG